MCYIGKATKIFIFLITVLVITGLVLGFSVFRRTIHPNSHKCSANSCSQPDLYPPPPPLDFPITSTPNSGASDLYPPPPLSPSGSSSNLAPPPPAPSLAPPPSESSSNLAPPPPSSQGSVATSPSPPSTPVVVVAPPPGFNLVTPGRV